MAVEIISLFLCSNSSLLPDANAQFASVRMGAVWFGMASGDSSEFDVCRLGVDLDREILLRRPLGSELDNRDDRVGRLEAILDCQKPKIATF